MFGWRWKLRRFVLIVGRCSWHGPAQETFQPQAGRLLQGRSCIHATRSETKIDCVKLHMEQEEQSSKRAASRLSGATSSDQGGCESARRSGRKLV